MGIPSEHDYLELYYELSGATERLTRFHQVFAMFRGAVGSAGVAARGDLGNGVLPDAARVGRHLARAYAKRGVSVDRGRTMSLHERPGMTIDEAIRRRRSVRGFLPDEVPEATLREVFELAQWSPSNCNVQPWTPHVVSGEALNGAIAVAAGMRDEPIKPDWPADGKFTGVYRERQVDAAQKLYGAMGVARSDAVGRKMAYIRNHAFFDAPHAVLIFMPAPFDTREAADIGMYAQTLMLALTARGIASCAQGALGIVSRNHPRAARHSPKLQAAVRRFVWL